MAIIITDNKHYNDIAAAIREKSVQASTYKPEEMAAAILALDTGFWSEDYVAAFIQGSGSTQVVIPDSVTEIATYRFYGSALTSVDIPDNCKTINSCAFQGSSNLVTVNFGANTERISSNAFKNCKKLALTIIPDQIKYIGANAFDNCIALTEISLPELATCGVQVFNNCYKLATVTFRGTPAVTLPNNFFYQCTGLKNIYVPWSQDAAINANAPWGAKFATIHYNSAV